MTSHTERWAAVDGYEGRYEVSTNGGVKSLLWDRPRIMRPSISHQGYKKVNLSDGAGRKRTIGVHRLVALAFIPLDPDRTQVNHIDCNKLNNVVTNLEWCTPAENYAHAVDHGLNDFREYGLRLSIPVIGVFPDGRVVRYKSQRAADADGFCSNKICKCVNGIRKTHAGARWFLAT